MSYVLHILVLAMIYALLGISLEFLLGKTGLLSLAQAAFWGLGAYTSAIVSINHSASFALSMVSSVAVAVLVSFVVSGVSRQLVSDNFVVATFGFEVVVVSLFVNWDNLTGGPLGLKDIPRPELFGFYFDRDIEFAILVFMVLVVVFALHVSISGSPFGRVLRGIREDEILCESLGKNVFAFKVKIFCLAAGIAACAGSLYAHYVSFIDPTSFTLSESVLIISVVIIGGADSIWGALIGALILTVLPEGLRFLGLPTVLAANLRQVFYGSAMILMMFFRPAGLAGKYEFGR
jgi:branched-chain amino acid transport system permease protein